MALDDKRGTHDGGIGSVGGLPDPVAEHGYGRGGGLVVVQSEQAAAESANSKGSEIAAGDVLRAQRSGNRFEALTAHAQAPAPGLEGGNLFEFRGFCFEALVQRVGIHAPSVLRTAFHAAFVAFPDAVEPAGVRDGQGTEHYRVDQGKDGGRAANSQGQREYGGGGKNGRQPELPQGVAKIAWQTCHGHLSVQYEDRG